MLTHIHIKDLAVVESLELELHAGMTALTGETGAGKSILVDALGLALGDRGDTELIRPGAQHTEVSVAFDVAGQPAVQAFLSDQDLEADGECLVRRSLSAEGRSRGYINSRPVPMQTLRELGERLIDIHGQQAHQSLARRSVQRQVLDAHVQNQPLLETVATTYREWQAAHRAYEELRQASADRDARLDLLRYQVQELEALDPQADEIEALEAEHRQLANVGLLAETGQRVLQMLEGDETGGAEPSLSHGCTELQRLAELDARLGGTLELVDGALTHLREATGELRDYIEGLELDPERLQRVEQRLSALHDLARKHRVSPDALPGVLARLRGERDDLDQADTRLQDLQAQTRQLAERYREAAEQLSRARQAAAQSLSERTTALMQQLGMPQGQLVVQVEPLDEARWGAHGMDQVSFHVTTNGGVSPGPLAKIASGGELSRIGLAIQVTAADEGLPTLIFDEVDAGVGGGVAEIVGQQLQALGSAHQVLCVTHLPQVAAQAHHHLRVQKDTDARHAATTVEPLSPDARTEELARMLAGVEITEQSRAHAKEMLDRAQGQSGRSRKGRGNKQVGA